jgi:hypothetical protein
MPFLKFNFSIAEPALEIIRNRKRVKNPDLLAEFFHTVTDSLLAKM